MKAILISDKPKWCVLMMNGDKTVEVRTSKALAKAIQKLIDEYGYADIYDYCTKDKEQLTSGYSSDIKGTKYFIYNDNEAVDYRGKVLFKFRCYKVEEIKVEKALCVPKYTSDSMSETELCKKSCLSIYDLDDYLKGKTGYAIHISDLEIFTPKELSEFRHWVSYKNCKKCPYKKYYKSNPCLEIETLSKAPQNFCYVEGE